MIYYNVSCGRVGKWIEADNQTFSAFLSTQPGFRRKLTLVEPLIALTSVDDAAKDENCTVWTMAYWETRTLWRSVNAAGVVAAAAKFESIFGESVPPNRYPSPDGLTIEAHDSGGFPQPKVRLPAINGNDVVAYFQIKPGDKDVPGLPQYNRVIDPSKLLPTVSAMI